MLFSTPQNVAVILQRPQTKSNQKNGSNKKRNFKRRLDKNNNNKEVKLVEPEFVVKEEDFPPLSSAV